MKKNVSNNVMIIFYRKPAARKSKSYILKTKITLRSVSKKPFVGWLESLLVAAQIFVHKLPKSYADGKA
jgi:hypothetical protein